MALRDRTATGLLAGYTAVEIARGVAPELLSVAASIAVRVGVSSLAVSTAFEAGFLLVAFYVFAPTVFPAVVGPRRERPGFRIVVAFVSLTIALPASLALSSFEAVTVSPALVGGYLSAAVLVGGFAFAAYFRVTQPRPLADPDGLACAVLLSRIDDSASDHRQYVRRLDARSPWAGSFARHLTVCAGTATYLGPCILFGVAAAALDGLFPLLELVVVAGLLARGGSRFGIVDWTVPNLETRVYDHLTAATRSVRGTAGIVMVLVGLVLAAFLAVVWVRVGTETWPITNALDAVATSLDSERPGRPLHEAVVGLLGACGGVVALPIASGYAIWYWIQELRRFAAVEGGGDAATGVGRPPGLLAEGAGLTVGWFAYWSSFPAVETVFAVTWPLLALALFRNVHRTRRGVNRPATESRWALPAAFVIYAGSVTGSMVFFLDVRTNVVLAVVFPVWLFHLDRLTDPASALRGRLLRAGYGLVLFLGVFAMRDPLDIGWFMLGALGVIVAALAFGQAFAHVFEPSTADR